MYIYDDRGSKKAVDTIITKCFQEVAFMKNFAAVLVQNMEKNVRVQSHVGGHRLLQWSCLLLSKSKFTTVSKNAFSRVATVQASLLHIVVQISLSEQQSCKKTFYHLFSQVSTILLQFILRRSILWIPFLFSYEITCFSFPYQLPEINKLYMEELKEARIPYKDSPELLLFLMEFSSTSRKSSSLFEQCKVSDYVIDNLVWL